MKELEKYIISEYVDKQKSISQIVRENNITYCKVQKILRENNITIRGGRKKKTLTEEQLKQFQQYRNNGVTYKELSKIFNLDKATLERIAKEQNIIRPNQNRINKRILSNYFSNIDTPEKAYWLGLLITDGSVDSYKGHYRIRLQLQAQDKEILEKFQKCLQLDSKIIENKREGKHAFSVQFNDKQIFQDLANYNIVPNKTYLIKNLPLDKIPQAFLKDYARGLLDGDGCITFSSDKTTDVSINFTSYYQSIVKDFQFLIDNLIGKQQHNKNIYTTAWHTQWRGKQQVLKILDILYKDSTIYLQRKYNKYLELRYSQSINEN